MASSPPTPRMAAPRICVCLGVDDDLHKALRLTLFHRPADPGHRPLAHQRRAAGRAHLVDGHPGAAQRRVDVERVGGDRGR